MLQLLVSLVFGLTVGVIMSLMLWLNTRLKLGEMIAIAAFVLIGGGVWLFTNGRFTDITLIALLVVWTLGRILFDRKRTFEKMLTFAMSTTLVLNYYIYLRFIGLRTIDKVESDYTMLIYMLVYLLIIAAGFVGCEDYVAEASKVALTNRGNVDAKEGSYQTSVPKVFSAGDMRRGQSLVVWAIAEGRHCAAAVDEYLMGYTPLI